MPSSAKPVTIAPWDEHNQKLVANVHPADWVNPPPALRYDLVVIGAGTAGLVTAAGAAGLGAKVALVEKHFLGGDCLNVGCVPSKCLHRATRAMADIRRAGEFGVRVFGEPEIDFKTVMERLRRIRADVSQHDSAKRFRDLGVDVFLGEARFIAPGMIETGGAVMRFKKAVIATGARAAVPAVEGLNETGYLTNETVFSLTQCPRRLAVIGGGPIGCELAQAFRRFGCEVILFHKNAHLLDREDSDAAEVIQTAFIREGVRLKLNSTSKRVSLSDAGKIIECETNGKSESVVVDEILLAVGRAPNVEGLGLDAAGVEFDSRLGVKVNDRLQTTNPRIYTAGDVCMKWKFTHAADAAARIVVQNALFLGRKKLNSLTVPWCTYTDPEVAHVGLSAQEAKKRGIELDSFSTPLNKVDRAIVDGATEGFAKVHVRKGTDRIIGATVVAEHAGEMINELTLAMAGKLGLGALANVIHPYPTQAEAIKKTADAWNRTRLTPLVKRLFGIWLSRKIVRRTIERNCTSNHI